ncbi:multiple epidermal growth factor-like domains protein 6 [Gigantopelta aegis]|uniref:multiple epidermal growth factor-like domains protein 6 n=1 Tax=Gigantopelta aegis TaxID=1735272 RepID=UPI001B88AC3A|nr:multiple epidermal growth factor-like domains protein 6 [Gigantopelta aegis]
MQSCPTDTGKCTGGCQPGWEGEDCSQECEASVKYGPNCTKYCYHRQCDPKHNSSCPAATGKCTGECQPGWKGEDCMQACQENEQYGPGCKKNCTQRQCASSTQSCNIYTGDCDTGGCKSGWKGDDCTQECEAGVEYGSNCSRSCADRHCDSQNKPVCLSTTGTCPGECQPGWKGDDCTEACTNNEEYGSGCMKLCTDRHCMHPSASCDIHQGYCGTEGCKPGWKGDDCTAECQKGVKYGLRCLKLCDDRHCDTKYPSSCPAATGKCPHGCQPGWKGDECNQECQKGVKYGHRCLKLCDDRHCDTKYPSSCPAATGKCPRGCQPGWKGDECNQACTKNYKYGHNCKNLCRYRHCFSTSASCDIRTGDCGNHGCKPGWKGNDCTHACTKNYSYGPNCKNQCRDRHCSASPAPCGKQTGECGSHGCKPGWKGRDCTQACKTNYSYGPNCRNLCRDRHCSSSSAPCGKQTGYCDSRGCKPGWKGVDCTQACRKNYSYGPNCKNKCRDRHCSSSSAPCGKQTGYCDSRGCKPGWKGGDCAQACIKGYSYGPNCTNLCRDRHCSASSAPCDTQTGDCGYYGCKPGWRGGNCAQACSSRTYGNQCALMCQDRHCNGASSCNHTTGICEHGCKTGWEGLTCVACEQNVWYGSKCNKFCKDRHCADLRADCNVHNGYCAGGCQAGWNGYDCIAQCSLNVSYGPKCKKHCTNRNCASPSAPCDVQTGTCGTGGCKPGWDGEDCTKGCMKGDKYGPNCHKFCTDRHCITSRMSRCDVRTGSCYGRCEPGWSGVDCTQACQRGVSYGSNCTYRCATRHCLNNSTCDVATGTCVDGCQPGWINRDCSIACKAGIRYGPNCSLLCVDRHCRGQSSCDLTDGHCETNCQAGWKGVDCRECDWRYGVRCHLECSKRNCKNDNSPCDFQTGECVGGCKPGWIHSTCTEECKSGHYGDGCSSLCTVRNCHGNSTCAKATGECIDGCMAGWNGIPCTIPCSSGKYGMNCNSTCGHCKGEPCDIFSGNCTHGCMDGFYGSLCNERSFATGMISGVVSAAIIVIILVVIIVVLFMRRRKTNSQMSDTKTSNYWDTFKKAVNNPNRLKIC